MYRQIKLAGAARTSTGGATAVFVTSDGGAKRAKAFKLGKPADQHLATLLKRDPTAGDACAVSTLHPDAAGEPLLVAGLGAADAIDGESIRSAVAAVVRAAERAQVSKLSLQVLPALDDEAEHDEVGEAIGDALALVGFRFEDYHGAAKADAKPKPGALTVTVESKLRKTAQAAMTVGQGVTTARTLAATPPNDANPAAIAAHCRKLAKQVGLKCTVIDAKRAKTLGFGGLLAVGGAGSTPPCLIVLEHKVTPSGKKPVMLVGKAITFDTGGYSLKPGGGKGMKYDKCGGMAVIGAMEAVARLKLKKPVVGLIPCAENMVSETAYRPDDILTMANGVTVEVTNTDAEGRLVLADALAYGTKKYKPEAVIDLATLTGGVFVALGRYSAGYFCNDDALCERIETASEQTGERVWQLPLWDDHRKQMASQHADIVNSSAERGASPIQGAAFLSYFVGQDAATQIPTTPWCHLDIAGVASTDKETALYEKGPTGFGVRLVVKALRDW